MASSLALSHPASPRLSPRDAPALDLDAAFDLALEAQTEHVRHRRDRKRRGVFYTPRFLARALAWAALAPRLEPAVERGDVAAIEALRVLDPAVGAGGLLLEALALLEEAHRLAWRVAGRAPLASTPREASRRRRQRLCEALFGVDIDPGVLRATRAVFTRALGGATPGLELVAADALLDAWPARWPRRFDVVLANPPYGSVNRLGRHDARHQALAARYPSVWQDKVDISAFFVAQAMERAQRAAFVLPATLLAADKARRLRAHVQARCTVRCLDLGDARVFDSAAVRTALWVFEPSDAPRFRGWRVCHAAPRRDDVRDVVGRFAAAQAPDEGEVAVVDRAPAGRWFFVSRRVARRWQAMDAQGPRLGERYALGKGMETGCNRAFEIGALQAHAWREALGEEATARVVRPRIRNSDIGVGGRVQSRDTWLVYTPGVDAFEALPRCAREHLLAWRDALERRAAFRRGDCAWWTFSWPLHAARYARWRVVTPYRSRSHRFAVVPPDGGVGLTDTSVIFCDTRDDADALSGLLMSASVRDRYAGLTKFTGGGMMEFFENQLRDVPLPASWERDAAGRARLAAAQRAAREVREPDARAAREAARDALVAQMYG